MSFGTWEGECRPLLERRGDSCVDGRASPSEGAESDEGTVLGRDIFANPCNRNRLVRYTHVSGFICWPEGLQVQFS